MATKEEAGPSPPPAAKAEPKEEEVRSYWYPDRKPDFDEVSTGYRDFSTDRRILILAAIPILLLFLYEFWAYNRLNLWWSSFIISVKQQEDALGFFKVGIFTAGTILLLLVVVLYFSLKSKPIYLIDFETYDAPEELKITHEIFIQKSIESGFFDKEALDFQSRLIYRTGLGNETYFPLGYNARVPNAPPEVSMARAREEAEMVLFGTLELLFKKTNVSPQEIDIVIVNCSLFNPTPSLAEMIINKFKLRNNIIAYNIAGMGCSAGVVALDLAKDLLQARANSLAVVCSTENITQNWYTGREKGMLLSNTLFRMGGAAILLSNKWKDSWRAHYQLQTIVRVHKGASDKAFKSVYQEEDNEGKKGVRISKDLMSVVGDALKSNLTVLGPQVLPLTEQIKFFVDLISRRITRSKRPGYVPDFKKAFQHFCIHAGGRAVIDGLEENLKLEPRHVEPSRATLYRYGNTSSSSIWYELKYSERMGVIKSGDNIWQIAFGSGFQCNSAVWKALKSIK